MNYIVGDIGNTSTRICLLNEKSKITKSIIFDTNKIFSTGYVTKIFKKFYKMKVKKKILFSSVVPLAFKILKNKLRQTNFKVIEIKKLNLRKLIKINIKNFNQLGSDRIVNSIEGKNIKTV